MSSKPVTAVTVPIDTGAHPPRDYPIYTTRQNPPGSLIGGHHVYRQDPGENVYHVLAQGLDEDEARACVLALNEMAETRHRHAMIRVNHKERNTMSPDGPVLKVPLSAEAHLGETWDSLERFHRQQTIGIATAKSELAMERNAGHLVIHDSIVHTIEDAKAPTPEEQRHTSPLHWALMTHDLTCALGHLANMARHITRGMVVSAAERPIVDLAVAAVAFTVQLAMALVLNRPAPLNLPIATLF
jgi:hypothetical protein